MTAPGTREGARGHAGGRRVPAPTPGPRSCHEAPVCPAPRPLPGTGGGRGYRCPTRCFAGARPVSPRALGARPVSRAWQGVGAEEEGDFAPPSARVENPDCKTDCKTLRTESRFGGRPRQH